MVLPVNKIYSFSIEGYYKWMKHLMDYKDNYQFLPPSTSWEDKLTQGKGRSYGVELIARKEKGKITGWAVIVISIGNRCFVKEDSYEKVTPVCRVISAKTLRMGVCFISNVTRGSSCSVPFASMQMCMRQRSRRKENLEWNCIIGLCLVLYLVFGL